MTKTHLSVMTALCALAIAQAASATSLQMPPQFTAPNALPSTSIFVLDPPKGPADARKLDAQNTPTVKRAESLVAKAANGDIQTQRQAYIAAIALDETMIANRPQARTAYYQEANYQFALALLDMNSLASRTSDIELAAMYADIQLRLGKAIQMDETGIALDPKSTAAYAQESYCDMELGQMGQTMAQNAKTQASHDEAVKLSGTQFSRAIDLDNTVIKLDPHDTDAYYEKASIQGGAGDDDAGIATDEADIKANPKDLDAYYQETDLYFDIGQYRSSIAEDKKIVAIDHSQSEAYANGGWLMECDNDYSQAIAFYQEGIKNNPKVSLLPYQLGSYYFNTAHDYAKAIAAFQLSVACPDADWNDWKMLAHAQEKAGKWIEAENTWTMTLNRFGSVPIYRPVLQNNLARVQKYIAEHSVAPGQAG